jgi:hypothetical protein
MLGAKDLGGGYDLVLQDLLLVVEVMKEEIEGGDSLDQARLKPRPFTRRDDAWDQVEGEDALGALGVIVDGEGHAASEEGQVHSRPPPLEFGKGKVAQAFDEAAIVGANLAPGRIHFVEKISWVVGVT